MGLIRFEESPGTPCPNLFSCVRKERDSFRGEGGVGVDLSSAVISPCIKAKFKQTSAGAVTVRKRNVLPVCDSALCDLWLHCHHLTYDAMFTP